MVQAHFQNIRISLIREIEKANISLKVAVYWFTNHELFNLLYQKQLNGVQCDLIIHNDYINNRDTGLPFQKFIDAGGKLYFSDEENPMHNKFCIIDNQVLINGSYNWTYYAESKNRENVLIIKDEQEVLKAFEAEFTQLIKLVEPLQTIAPLTKFEVEENILLRNRDYLAHDIIYQAKVSNNPEMVKTAFEIAPQNLSIQKIANDLGLIKKESLGTLYSTFGADADVIIHNISNTKKRVFLTVTNSQGQGQNFTLSKRLSELVRDREVTISEVMFNPITLETTAPNPETKEYDENYVKNEFYVINVASEKFSTKVGQQKVRKPKTLADYRRMT
jgi:hypothetical protein